jgi:hypothetical protein
MTLLGVEKLNTYIPKIRLPLEPAHLYSIYKVLDLSSTQNKRYVLSCVFKFLKVPGLNAAFNTFLVFLYNAVHSFNPFSEIMLGIVRNIWLLCSYFNIQIKAIHIQGIDNRVADLLSRWTEIRSPYEITSLHLFALTDPAHSRGGPEWWFYH